MLKISYNNVIKKKKLQTKTFKELHDTVLADFPSLKNLNFQLFYIDDEDKINVSDDSDIEMMLLDNPSLVKIFVQVDSTNASCLSESIVLKNTLPEIKHEEIKEDIRQGQKSHNEGDKKHQITVDPHKEIDQIAGGQKVHQENLEKISEAAGDQKPHEDHPEKIDPAPDHQKQADQNIVDKEAHLKDEPQQVDNNNIEEVSNKINEADIKLVHDAEKIIEHSDKINENEQGIKDEKQHINEKNQVEEEKKIEIAVEENPQSNHEKIDLYPRLSEIEEEIKIDVNKQIIEEKEKTPEVEDPIPLYEENNKKKIHPKVKEILGYAKDMLMNKSISEENSSLLWNFIIDYPKALIEKPKERILLLLFKKSFCGLAYEEEFELHQLSCGQIFEQKNRKADILSQAKILVTLLKRYDDNENVGARQKLLKLYAKNSTEFETAPKIWLFTLNLKKNHEKLTEEEEKRLLFLNEEVKNMRKLKTAWRSEFYKKAILADNLHNEAKALLKYHYLKTPLPTKIRENLDNLLTNNSSVVFKNIPQIRSKFLLYKKDQLGLTTAEEVELETLLKPQIKKPKIVAHEPRGIDSFIDEKIEKLKPNIMAASQLGSQLPLGLSQFPKDQVAHSFIQMAELFIKGNAQQQHPILLENYKGKVVSEINQHPQRHSSKVPFIYKTLLIQNIGKAQWDARCTLRTNVNWQIPHNIALPHLHPNEEAVVTMQIPNQNLKEFFIEVSFYIEEKMFGISAKVKILNMPEEHNPHHPHILPVKSYPPQVTEKAKNICEVLELSMEKVSEFLMKSNKHTVDELIEEIMGNPGLMESLK